MSPASQHPIACLPEIVESTPDSPDGAADISPLSVRDVLRDDRVVTYFQPILSARQRAILGVEALARVPLADGSVVGAPWLFRHAAQEGLLAELERRCCEKAIERFAQLPHRRDDHVLFVAGLHRRSVLISLALLAGALMVGNSLAPLALTSPTGSSRAAVLAVTAVAVIIAVALARSTSGRILAGVLTALAVPLVLNRPEPIWFAFLVLGTMFVGTVLYRSTSGQIAGWIGG